MIGTIYTERKNMKEKIKKNLKTIISVLTTILGLGFIGIVANFNWVSGEKIVIEKMMGLA